MVGVDVRIVAGVPLLAALTGVWVLLMEERKMRLLQADGAGGSSKGFGNPNGDTGQ